MKKILLLILSVVLLGACSSEDNNNIGGTQTGTLKTYSADLLLATPKGEGTDVITRGLNPAAGEFTNEYPYDYIYLHSADSKTKEEGHQRIRIPLKDVEFCDGCEGIHLEMEVLDNDEGYIVRNEAGDEIKLGKDDEVYFSTIDDTYWKAKVEGASPVTGSDVFFQDTINVNKELLRSAIASDNGITNHDYSKDDLIALLSEGEPEIPMSRHCTAFRVYFMFTDVNEGSDGAAMGFDKGGVTTAWNNMMKEEYNGGEFYIKLYLGPNFAEKYNVYTDDVSNPEEIGYYVTNEQKYQPFEFCDYSTTSGTGGTILFNGFGYITDLGNYLIAPLNTHLNAEDFSVYAFIKYAPEGTVIDDEFLTSDEGAKWFQLQVPSMTLEPNRVHFIILGVDKDNLKVFKETTETNSAKTRAISNGPEEIKVKSAIVKDIVE